MSRRAPLWTFIVAVALAAPSCSEGDRATLLEETDSPDVGGVDDTTPPTSGAAEGEETIDRDFGLDCADECSDGFVVDDTTYVLSCGALDLDQYGVTDEILASGPVMWSDDPIEVRPIAGYDGDHFVAVQIDPDICQRPEAESGWFVASQDLQTEREALCLLIGGTWDAAGDCAEPTA